MTAALFVSVPLLSQQRISKGVAFPSILSGGDSIAVMACQLWFTNVERFGGGEENTVLIIVLWIDLLFLYNQIRKNEAQVLISWMAGET